MTWLRLWERSVAGIINKSEAYPRLLRQTSVRFNFQVVPPCWNDPALTPLRGASHMAYGATLAWFIVTGMAYGQQQPVPTPATISQPQFETHIRPILRVYCLDCHGAEEKLQGSLDLRQVRLMQKGGKSGPALLKGNHNASLILKRMKDGEMPPGEKKVPPSQIEIIEHWVTQGAPTIRPEPEKIDPGVAISAEDRNWWAYQTLNAPKIPATNPLDRARTSVDAFLIDAMRPKNLAFAPDADKRTYIRRVALDLTGLPPTAAEINGFLRDSSPNAAEKLVDTYLASPAYAERWARHWLDVFGYADSDGDGTNDAPRPYSYKFRDYLIRSIEKDKPLNQLFLEMLAGDEMLPRPLKDPSPQQADLLAATMLLRLGPDATAAGGEQVIVADQVMADSLKIVGSSLLGLTVGCAQCHDHKYDPIPHNDYFRLRAIFAPAWNPAAWKAPASRLVSLMTEAQRKERTQIEAKENELVAARDKKAAEWIAKVFEDEVNKFPEKERQHLRDAFKAPADKRTPEQKKLVETNPKLNISAGVLYQFNQKAVDDLKKFDDELTVVRAKKPVEDFISCLMEDPGLKVETRLNHRGDPRQPKGKPLNPADLTIAQPEGARSDLPVEKPPSGTTGYRTAWTKSLFTGRHPLVGRVLANRIWLNHFGKGIVETPADFGQLGRLPSHPALLDHLAVELAKNNWSQKAMHRLIVNSTVYRQTSTANRKSLEQDQSNALYTRFPVHRLEAEAIRDRILATTGNLDPTLFGPSIVTNEDASGLVNATSNRRGIYLQVRRSRPETMLASFDAPVLAPNCDKRTTSNAPTQALVLMNGEFVRAQSVQLAKRVRAEAAANTHAVAQAKNVAASPIVPLSVWAYGHSRLTPEGLTIAFNPLPHWTGGQWQGGGKLPDPAIGWVLLNAAGGHPGNKAHAAVRRLTVHRDGFLEISGTLKHASPSGDGVRARVIAPGEKPSERIKAAEWLVKNSSTQTAARLKKVRAGDVVDFVVDCIETETSDGFEWPLTATLKSADGNTIATLDSTKEFAGPPGPSLVAQGAHAIELVYGRPPREGELNLIIDFMRLQAHQLAGKMSGPTLEDAVVAQLCQQLLSTNEFLYVD